MPNPVLKTYLSEWIKSSLLNNLSIKIKRDIHEDLVSTIAREWTNLRPNTISQKSKIKSKI